MVLTEPTKGGLAGSVASSVSFVRAARRAVAAAAAGTGSGADESDELLGSGAAAGAAGGASLRGGVVALERRAESDEEILHVAAAAAAVRRPVCAAYSVGRGVGTVSAWPVRAPTAEEPHAVLLATHFAPEGADGATFALDTAGPGRRVGAATATVVLPERWARAVQERVGGARAGAAGVAAGDGGADGGDQTLFPAVAELDAWWSWLTGQAGAGGGPEARPDERRQSRDVVLRITTAVDGPAAGAVGSLPGASECRSMFVLASVVAPPLAKARDALGRPSTEAQAEAAEALEAIVAAARASLAGMAEHF